jgi:hypothetical protein
MGIYSSHTHIRYLYRFSAKICTAKSCYTQFQIPIIAIEWIMIQFSRKNNGAKRADDIDLQVQVNDRKSFFWIDSSEVGFAACFTVPPSSCSQFINLW